MNNHTSNILVYDPADIHCVWLGDLHYKNYYLYEDGRVWNDKFKRWVRAAANKQIDLSYAPNKFRHEWITNLLNRYFYIPKLLRAGFRPCADGALLVNDCGKVFNTNSGSFSSLSKIGSGRQYYGAPADGKPRLVHRLVAEAFLENPDTSRLTDVNHRNGNPHDNCVDNLEWCTHKSNMRHAYRDGKPWSLKPSDVEQIRRYREQDKAHYTYTRLAEMFNTSPSAICAAAIGQNWGNNADYANDESSRRPDISQLGKPQVSRTRILSTDPDKLRQLWTRINALWQPSGEYPGISQELRASEPPSFCYDTQPTRPMTREELEKLGYKVIPGFNNEVYVSRDGKVYDVTKGLEVHQTVHANHGGEHTVYLNKTSWKVHRLMARAFGLPDGKLVTHINGNRGDNRIENLRVADVVDIKSAVDRGRACDKLNTGIANDIRTSFANGSTLKDIATKYHIHPDTARMVVRGYRWQ